jgi:hypothetical protein
VRGYQNTLARQVLRRHQEGLRVRRRGGCRGSRAASCREVASSGRRRAGWTRIGRPSAVVQASVTSARASNSPGAGAEEFLLPQHTGAATVRDAALDLQQVFRKGRGCVLHEEVRGDDGVALLENGGKWSPGWQPWAPAGDLDVMDGHGVGAGPERIVCVVAYGELAADFGGHKCYGVTSPPVLPG